MMSADRQISRRRLSVPQVAAALCWLHLFPVLGGLFGGWAGFACGLFGMNGLVLWTTLYPHSRWFGCARRSIRGADREICLTIDDGPCADTPRILELLARHQVKAVFFLVGRRVLEYPEHARAIAEAGHILGNHTFSHPAHAFWCYPPVWQRRELRRCQEILADVAGVEPGLFRAPAGLCNPFCHAVAGEFGLEVVGWRTRGYDGVRTDVEKIIRRMRRKIRPGSIVVLHQGRPHSYEVIRRTLDMLAEEGWKPSLGDDWRP